MSKEPNAIEMQELSAKPKKEKSPTILLDFMHPSEAAATKGFVNVMGGYLKGYKKTHPNAQVIHVDPKDFDAAGNLRVNDEGVQEKYAALFKAKPGVKIKVFGHGASADGYIQQDRFMGYKFSAKQVASVIKAAPLGMSQEERDNAKANGTPYVGRISLISCEGTAGGEASFARHLYDELNPKDPNAKTYPFLIKGSTGMIAVSGGPYGKYSLTPTENFVATAEIVLEMGLLVTLATFALGLAFKGLAIAPLVAALGITWPILGFLVAGLVALHIVARIAFSLYVRYRQSKNQSNADNKRVLVANENGEVVLKHPSEVPKPKQWAQPAESLAQSMKAEEELSELQVQSPEETQSLSAPKPVFAAQSPSSQPAEQKQSEQSSDRMNQLTQMKAQQTRSAAESKESRAVAKESEKAGDEKASDASVGKSAQNSREMTPDEQKASQASSQTTQPVPTAFASAMSKQQPKLEEVQEDTNNKFSNGV